LDHVEQPAPAAPDQFGDVATTLRSYVDDQTSSTGSMELAVRPSFVMHLRPRDLELVALAPHRLDQDREVQLAAAGDGEDVGLLGWARRG
jgi:hypothetical protein